MTILILYATTEGQTRKIAERAAAHIRLGGKTVETVNLADGAPVDLTAPEAVILAASVHAGSYQPEFLKFVTDNRDAIAGLRHVFVSVSLSAASSEAEDRESLDSVVLHMSRQTGWTPAEVWHVGGAFRFTQYDFLKRWAMRWIAARRDPEADRDGDTEYTDWTRLNADLDRFLA